jgi:hypothetical protein
MRTTINLPDETYRTVKRLAVEENSTVREMLMEALALLLLQRTKRPASDGFQLPLIRSRRTDMVKIDSEKIYEVIDFP